ncbi:MAG TPA: biotin carboxylase N-terminal domain-containing protein [Thermomicrobiaceae bacterium]|nr:biotin carboxylase N-terminal domain-containing protein [Thermomicrobiaceae bacterium]
MTRRLAIANRGEVAIRIAATCRLRGIEPVLLVGEPDADGLAARAIGRVEVLGPAGSELDPDLVVAAARRAGAALLHPGYGFLSERPALSAACAAAGITFVGPTPETLERCGDKVETRRVAVQVGVPVLAASLPLGPDPAEWRAAAVEIGYPVLVKAALGGGGASLRRVSDPDALEEAVASSRREAEAAGAGPVLYLERFLEDARHIEVQVAGDGTRALAIGDRECSLQRRHQKVIEEAPAPNLPDDARRKLHGYAVAVAEAVKLASLATVEFLYGADGTIAFLEVNPRLQVEHPVTEAVAGIDLVALQLDVADGCPLLAEAPAPRGHAIEARLYAEDPANHYLPSPGRLDVLALPAAPRLRVDAAYAAGDTIPGRYDPLIAKLVAFSADRDAAVATLRDALVRTGVAGVATNRPWLIALLDDPRVRAGRYSTATAAEVPAPDGPPGRLAGAALLATALDRPPSDDPWERIGPFRLSGAAEIAFSSPDGGWERVFKVERAGAGWRVEVADDEDGGGLDFRWWRGADDVWTVDLGGGVGRAAVVRRADGTLEITDANGRWLARPGRRSAEAGRGAARADGIIRAPLPGKVLRVPAEPEQVVVAGEPLVIMSAMKIEVVLRAPAPGRVTTVRCWPDEQVDAGDVLVELALEAEP